MGKERFVNLWLRCGGDAIVAEERFDQLVQLYGEPQRHYHTFDHITHCLAKMDEVVEQVKCPEALELAIWYHDAIYQISAKDNEQRSKDLFIAHSSEVLDDNLRQQVYALIMVTVHPSVPSNPDQCLMVDIDLASFCLPWREFLRDSNRVRKELAHLSDVDFNAGQIHFLRILAGREWFYNSPHYRQHHEQAAHDNINHLLLLLQDGDGVLPTA